MAAQVVSSAAFREAAHREDEVVVVVGSVLMWGGLSLGSMDDKRRPRSVTRAVEPSPLWSAAWPRSEASDRRAPTAVVTRCHSTKLIAGERM